MVEILTQQKEFEEMLALSSYAFNKTKQGHEIDSFYQLCTHATNWGVKENQTLSSQVMAIPYQVCVGGKQLSMSGIGNVATYPENRGRGHIRQLFQAMLEDLYQNKIQLSYLAPFSYPFYRKFGYEQTIDRQIFQLTAQAMNFIKNEPNGHIIRTSWATTPFQEEIKQCYAQTLGQKNGSLIRSDWDWQYINERYYNRLFALCLDDQQQVTGYLIYEMNGSEFQIIELAANIDWARRKLWSFVASHSASFESFLYPAAITEDLSDLFVDPRLYTRLIQPYMMSRIVHFQAFLTSYPWKAAANGEPISFVLGVKEDCCETNNGQWQLTFDGKQASCTKVAEQADFTATIQTWTQVFTGYYSFEHALRAGLIHVYSDQKVALIKSSLPELEKPILYNYF